MTATAALLAEGRWTTRRNDDAWRVDALGEAADPNTSPWRLATLADDPDLHVRLAVAANPSASALTIMRLHQDLDPRIQVVLEARGEADR